MVIGFSKPGRPAIGGWASARFWPRSPRGVRDHHSVVKPVTDRRVSSNSLLSAQERQFEPEEIRMLNPTKIVLALALALASAMPAVAAMNGTDYLNYRDAAKRSPAGAQIESTDGLASAFVPAPPARASKASVPHRYRGGPKSIH
jgi:hypothetical protein